VRCKRWFVFVRVVVKVDRLAITCVHCLETKFTSIKPSSPAGYEQKKYIVELSSPAANGGAQVKSRSSTANAGAIACSNLSKHIAMLPPVKSSSPIAIRESKSVVTPNEPKLKSKFSYVKCVAINWLNQDATKNKVCKYVKFDVDVPLSQEDQLEMLMDQFSLAELKAAYFVTMGKVGLEDPSEIVLPNNACKETVISSFIALIYDHCCMMGPRGTSTTCHNQHGASRSYSFGQI
jgi:hypothetical protein